MLGLAHATASPLARSIDLSLSLGHAAAKPTRWRGRVAPSAASTKSQPGAIGRESRSCASASFGSLGRHGTAGRCFAFVSFCSLLSQPYASDRVQWISLKRRPSRAAPPHHGFESLVSAWFYMCPPPQPHSSPCPYLLGPTQPTTTEIGPEEAEILMCLPWSSWWAETSSNCHEAGAVRDEQSTCRPGCRLCRPCPCSNYG